MKNIRFPKTKKNIHLSSLLLKAKNSFSRTGVRTVALLVVCAMVFSILPVIDFNVSASETGLSQTKYKDIADFQNQNWAAIQQAVFDGYEDPNKNNNILDTVVDFPTMRDKWTVKPGNKYFNWTKTGLKQWNGVNNNYVYMSKDDVGFAPFTRVDNYRYEAEYTDAKGEKFYPSVDVKYTYIEVATPEQFRWAMEACDKWADPGENIMINIVNDLDFGGDTGSTWTPIDLMPKNKTEPVYDEKGELVFDANGNVQWKPAYEYTGDPKKDGEGNLIYETYDGTYGEKLIGQRVPDLDQYGKIQKDAYGNIIYRYVYDSKEIAQQTPAASVYIEGNGYTIYNLKIYGDGNTGIVGQLQTKLMVKNLGFQSTMLFNQNDYNNGSGLLVGLISRNARYRLYNVHSNEAYMQVIGSYGLGGLIGRSFDVGSCSDGNCFIENCSTKNYYMYGGPHMGGISSYLTLEPHESKRKAIKYDAEFPETPEAFFYSDDIYYPIEIINTYSTDCEIYSTGSDSGALISCGGDIVARNCFTNNSLYADLSSGAFIGRCGDSNNTYLYDDAGKKKISSYFDQCYASGRVEGSVALGGFVGLDNVGRAWTNSEENKINTSDSIEYMIYYDMGADIFKNCYTTAAVGADYAGKYCGGFVGFDENTTMGTTIEIEELRNKTDENGYAVIDPETGEAVQEKVKVKHEGNGSFYINCYAAGEVGNILTVSDINGTDPETGTKYETLYLANDEGKNKKGEILKYYPTGGFIGVIMPELYWWYRDHTNAPYSEEKWEEADKAAKADPNECMQSVYQVEKIAADGVGFGNFYNCYYDMQTTAMREMAIGMLDIDTCRGKKYTLDAGGNQQVVPYSVVGIEGVYTEESEKKHVDGLTDFPSGPNGFAMDMDGADSSVWHYEHEYYPQLKVFMAGDLRTSNGDLFKMLETDAETKEVKYQTDANGNIKTDENDHPLKTDKTVSVSDAERKQIEESPFYIPITTEENEYKEIDGKKYYLGNRSREVKNQYCVNDKGELTGSFDRKFEILTAFRYSQASTAAVMLDHWDTRMDIATGGLPTDTNWQAGLAVNHMEKKTKVDPNNPENVIEYYEIRYNRLNAGRYEFKVQAGSSTTLNYGSDGFKGRNCVLELDKEGCDVVITFQYDELRSENYQIYAYAYDGYLDGKTSGDKDRLYFQKLLGGKDLTTSPTEKWSLIGTLAGTNWNKDFFLERVGVTDIYTYEMKLDPLTQKNDQGEDVVIPYQFKVRRDEDWAVNYGPGGVKGSDDNMGFTIIAPCTVTFTFNGRTHITTVKANPADAIKDISTEGKIDYGFRGFSVIGQQSLTGHNWLEKGTGNEAAVAADGELKEISEGSGIYVKTFQNVPMGKNYAYKIIENAMDEGQNSYFYIADHPTIPAANNPVCDVTFKYHSSDGTVEIEATVEGYTQNFAQEGYHFFGGVAYSVLGDEGLTGFFWAGDKDHPGTGNPADDESYKQRAILNGRMDVDPTSAGVLWRKDFNGADNTGVPAGTYGFKVAAEGNLDYAWGENGGSGNFYITLTEKAKVTVTFNSNRTLISVKTDPPQALSQTTYVVTGVESLMGLTWNLEMAEMTYDEIEGKYIYDFPYRDDPYHINPPYPDNPKPIKAKGSNYALKVIEYGVDSGKNISFSLGVAEKSDNYDPADFGLNPADYDEYYYLRVLYDPKETKTERKTEIKAYKVEWVDGDVPGEKVPTGVFGDEVDAIKDVRVELYSVLGDYGLTGHYWYGLDSTGFAGSDEERELSTKDGMMEKQDDGTYVKVYKNIAVGSEFDPAIYSFKVACNGNWDSGIDYGAEDGGDYVIILASDKVTTTTVTITFDPSTGKIDVTTNPDVSMTPDDIKNLEWYIMGDYELVSYDSAFLASAAIYDTVRDITSDRDDNFKFTSGRESGERGVAWARNEERNRMYQYFDYFGGTSDGGMGDGFTLGYNVDGKPAMTGTFKETILDLITSVTEDSYSEIRYDNNIASYTCENFAPGRQYLSVYAYGYGYSDSYNWWKQEYIQYQNYLYHKKVFDRLLINYYAVLGGRHYEGSNTPENVMRYLKGLKESADPEDNASFDNLMNTYGDIWAEAQEAYYKTVPDPGSAPDIEETDQIVVGKRTIRLIPQAYLEAGNDAKISVVKDKYSAMKNSNKVTYAENSVNTENEKRIIFNDENGEDITNLSYNRYNFAFTAAYAITDKIGLGVYDNYHYQDAKYNEDLEKHGIVPYDPKKAKALLDGRKEQNLSSRTDETFFAMTSTYTENKVYDDQTGTPLDVEKLIKQALIGDSYNYNYEDYDWDKVGSVDGSLKRFGQTVIKVYEYPKDENGNYIYDVDPAEEGTKILFADKESISKERYKNYAKWTGQIDPSTGQPTLFEPEDAGSYAVYFYWVMSDGRFFSDYKNVDIIPLEPGVVKSVEEFVDEASAEINELHYTVRYTNVDSDKPVTFALLDILPFVGDERVDDQDNGHDLKTATSDNTTKFTLKKLEVVPSIDEVNKTSAEIRGVYYTKSKAVQNYLSEDVGQFDASGYPDGWWDENNDGEEDYDPLRNTAKRLYLQAAVTGEGEDGKNNGTIKDPAGIWQAVKRVNEEGKELYPGGTYDFGDGIDDVTAIAVSGIQLGVGQQIDLKFTLAYEGVANDIYANNAFYHAIYENAQGEREDIASYSDPVSTVIVGREISGYSWIDKNLNSIYDENSNIVEPVIEGVNVTLYEVIKDSDGEKLIYYDSTTTNADGFYRFKDLPQKTFRTVFTGDTVTVHEADGSTRTVSFEFLGISKAPVNEINHDSDSPIGSYNLGRPYYLNYNEVYQSMFLFTDKQNWGTVYAHIWGDNGNLTGDWPGKQITQTVTNDDGETQFVIYVPYGATGIVLHNNNDEQTVNITNFNVDGYYTTGEREGGDSGNYLVKSWGGSSKSNYALNAAQVRPLANDGVAPLADGKSFLFTCNIWDDVYLHYWGSEKTDWPGVKLTEYTTNGFGEKQYVVNIPDGVEGLLFHNNKGEQTVDIKKLDVEGYYLTGEREGENNDGHYLVGYWPEDPDPDPGEGGDTGEYRTFLFTCNIWDKVFIHYWGTGGATQWPGIEVTEKTTNGFGETQYVIRVPVGTTGVVLHNGNGQQTVDITKLDVEGYYLTGETDGGKYLVKYWPEDSSGGDNQGIQPEYPVWNSYYIYDITMPSKLSIYGQTAGGVNVISQKNNPDYAFIFAKRYQNLALHYINSITIQKKFEGEDDFSGAKFRLEFKSESGEWVPVTYDENGYPLYGEGGENEYTTLSDGVLSFKNLADGKYRITEIATRSGHNLLSSDIEIDMPYGIAVGDSGFITASSEPYETIDGVNYYRDITLQISNTTNLSDLLPRTGSNELNMLLIALGALILVLGLVTILSQLRKKKAAQNTESSKM